MTELDLASLSPFRRIMDDSSYLDKVARSLESSAEGSDDSTPTGRLDRWLAALVNRCGSDLLLVQGAPPCIRVDGELRKSPTAFSMARKSKPPSSRLFPRMRSIASAKPASPILPTVLKVSAAFVSISIANALAPPPGFARCPQKF